MSGYSVNTENGTVTRLIEYQFDFEGSILISPQELLMKNPEIITDLPEMEIVGADILLSINEYPTSRGSIDLLIISSNADVIIIETKLLKNPEATRTVVAQVIDYIKAFSGETIDDIVRKMTKRDQDFTEKIRNDEKYAAILFQNIRTGNFKVAIVGDAVHPNVLGMVESIQSAPHLSFTIFLIELNAHSWSNSELVLQPRIVSNTNEVERSVIRIEVSPDSLKHKIVSSAPLSDGKGTKPRLSWDQYLASLVDAEVADTMSEFRRDWIEQIDDSINMGVVGFSAGVIMGNKRIPIQFVYDTRIPIISEKAKDSYNIPNKLYEEYITELKKSSILYDKYIASNRVEIPFEQIDTDTLRLVLGAALNLARKMKSFS